MEKTVAYNRSVRITSADGTRTTRKPRRISLPVGAPLPAIPAEVAASWVRQMSCYSEPVADVRFVYRKLP